jgi:hypothetical protein
MKSAEKNTNYILNSFYGNVVNKRLRNGRLLVNDPFVGKLYHFAKQIVLVVENDSQKPKSPGIRIPPLKNFQRLICPFRDAHKT